MKIYIAGPEVFLSNAKDIFKKKKEICEKYNFMAVFPYDNNEEVEKLKYQPRQMAQKIYEENIRLIDESDALIANITPFRGIHMDPGTSFEIGYAIAKNKQISCYTQDGRDLVSRVWDFSGEKTCNSCNQPLDKDGYIVENFGMGENLMIKSALNSQKRDVSVVDIKKENRFINIDGFEEAVKKLLKI